MKTPKNRAIEPKATPRARSKKSRKSHRATTVDPIQSGEELQADLDILKKMAFQRYECCAEDIRRFHVLRISKPKMAAKLEILRQWMLCPITLWPVNFHHLLTQALDLLESGKSLDKDFLLLLANLQTPPSADVQQLITSHEFAVATGQYENMVPASSKFQSIDEDAARNPELIKEWDAIASRWSIADFADSKGILRRTPVNERNLRPNFSADWDSPRERFQTTFDVFCARWNLYGMQGNKPLVLKPSVNPTAFGTMIFIPTYWSLDSTRDFDWKEIARLHKARSLRKQGPTLADGKAHRRSLAAKLRKADVEAKDLGLKGQARHQFLCKVLGWVPDTDPKRVSRLRKEFAP